LLFRFRPAYELPVTITIKQNRTLAETEYTKLRRNSGVPYRSVRAAVANTGGIRASCTRTKPVGVRLAKIERRQMVPFLTISGKCVLVIHVRLCTVGLPNPGESTIPITNGAQNENLRRDVYSEYSRKYAYGDHRLFTPLGTDVSFTERRNVRFLPKPKNKSSPDVPLTKIINRKRTAVIIRSVIYVSKTPSKCPSAPASSGAND